MSNPYDATTKHLVENRPADWLRWVGLEPGADVDILDTDLATVSAAADRVVRVKGVRPWLAHLELQSDRNPDLPSRTMLHNVLLTRHHHLPTLSILVLLRPKADRPKLTGVLEHYLPSGRLIHTFHYDVVRVYEQPAEAILTAGLGTLPLAPLADVPRKALPGVIRRMEARIEAEAEPEEAGLLWTSTFVLMGLRYKQELAVNLLKGVRAMKGSVTYQAIIEEGMEKGIEKGEIRATQAILLRLGAKRFGKPSVATKRRLNALTSAPQLQQMVDRILDVENWDELLATDEQAQKQ